MRKFKSNPRQFTNDGLKYEPIDRSSTSPNRPSYSAEIIDEIGVLQLQELRNQAHAQLEQLMRLHEESPEAVFGKERLERAFIDEKNLQTGETRLCVGCVDEGVQGVDGGPKIGVAGTGVMMTVIPPHDRARRMSADQVYSYLGHPQSGDVDFWKLVANLQLLKAQGYALDTSSHEQCGAVMHFIVRFKEHCGFDLDPGRVERAIAKRLHAALGLRGEPRRIGITEGHARLNRHPNIHDRAVARTLDDTGRFRPERLGIGTLLTTSMTAPSLSYLRTELQMERDILRGPDGLGIDPPVVLVSRNVRASLMKYATILKGETVLTMTAPS